MNAPYCYVVVACLCGWLCACGDADKAFEQQPDNCGSNTAASMRGEWKVVATGKSFDCDAARDEGKIDLDVDPFRVDTTLEENVGDPVVESGDEADAFVDRVNRATVKLTADTPKGATFEGESGTECEISFSITEQLSSGEKLNYDFKGWVREVDQATGEFTGSGPGGCKFKGTFTVDRS